MLEIIIILHVGIYFNLHSMIHRL